MNNNPDKIVFMVVHALLFVIRRIASGFCACVFRTAATSCQIVVPNNTRRSAEGI